MAEKTMKNTTEHEISFPENEFLTFNSFKKLIERNVNVFEKAVMSYYGNSSRFAFQHSTFTVTNLISEDGLTGSFGFEVDVSVDATSLSGNKHERVDEIVAFWYDPDTRIIKFSLDEVVWEKNSGRK